MSSIESWVIDRRQVPVTMFGIGWPSANAGTCGSPLRWLPAKLPFAPASTRAADFATAIRAVSLASAATLLSAASNCARPSIGIWSRLLSHPWADAVDLGEVQHPI